MVDYGIAMPTASALHVQLDVQNLTLGQLHQMYPDMLIIHQGDLTLWCAVCAIVPLGMYLLVKHIKARRTRNVRKHN